MLQSIWFLLWGVLWAVFFLLDGFDFGIGSMQPFFARNDTEKRTLYNAMGPYWDGNEVWLITAGGVTFAAFPGTYAVMFSALYTPLMLILFALIVRGVSFEFRSKLEGPGWRRVWDILHFLGSVLPAILLGVAFANIFQGIPIDAQGVLQGNLFSLLNPYGLAGGVFFLAMFCLHGALWLNIKTGGHLQARAQSWAKGLWLVVLVLAVAFLALTAVYTPLYQNYLAMPVLFVLPLGAVVALLAVRKTMGGANEWLPWFCSAAFILLCTLFGVVGLYPNLLPSNIDPAASMTAFNSSSSPLTLQIMLGVALVMVPIVIAYQFWIYKTFNFKVGEAELAHDEAY